MIHLFQKTQLGLCLSQPTQEHGLKKKHIRFSVLPNGISCGGSIFVSKESCRFDDDRLMLFFFLTMPGYDIFLKTFILKAIDFFYPGKGWEEDYKDERVFGFWQSYPFIVRSLSVNETRAQVPTIRTKRSLLDG